MTIKQSLAEDLLKNVRVKNLLALELDRSVDTIERHLRLNEDNGPLTLTCSIKVIKQELGLKESQIIVD